MPPNSSSAAVNATDLKDNEITPIEMTSKNKLRWYEPETKILWVNVTFIVTLHVISLYYFITFPYTEHKFLLVWSEYFNLIIVFKYLFLLILLKINIYYFFLELIIYLSNIQHGLQLIYMVLESLLGLIVFGHIVHIKLNYHSELFLHSVSFQRDKIVFSIG